MNRLLVGLVVVLSAGCNSQSVTASKVEPGAECPAGGIKLTGAGADQLLCNGTNGTSGTNGGPGGDGATALLSQRQLPAGDPRCGPNGGVEVAAGLDSGGDGGTPGDGVLQPGEVSSSTVVCAGDSKSRVGSLIPPAGAAGTSSVRANGGQSANQGGNGGSIQLLAVGGSNGGHLKAWRTGRADATFTVPTAPAADLGPEPLAITTDTTLTIPGSPSAVPAGTAFLTTAGLFISKGPNLPPSRVTGLSVAASATLTLPSPGFSTTEVARSCRIDGTLKLDRPTAQSGARLDLRCGDLVLSGSSKMSALGTAVARPGGSLNFSARGLLLALGTIDVSGFSPPAGSNQDAGNGGDISLSGSRVYASGALRSNGGSGESSVATRGGLVALGGGSVFNQAVIEANGGTLVSNADGDLTAGAGGQATLRSDDTYGEVRNRGAITCNGGSVTGTLFTGSAGNGGTGGTIGLSARFGPVTTDAALTALGGEGITSGGGGGSVTANLGGGAGPGQSGALLVSGDLDVSGGKGPLSGGLGGEVRLSFSDTAQVGAEVVLLGYQRLSADGAVGRTGGAGGAVVFEQAAQRYADGESIAVPVGAGGGVLNAVDVSARGGDADTSGQGPPSLGGGEGGSIDFSTQTDFAQPGATFEVLINTGTLSVNGGAGPNGGSGGTVYLTGTVSTSSTGAISATGGAGSSLGGGSGGYISVSASSGKLLNTAACEASAGVAGGGPVSTPGVGGSITLAGAPTSNSGTLAARGGSGDLTTGSGGEGGSVRLDSLGAGATENTVAAPAGIVVSGGAASKPGAPGTVLIDGFSVTDRWTH